MTVCPVKCQISLGICPVWSESSLCTQWVAKDSSFLHADSADSDQTGRLKWCVPSTDQPAHMASLRKVLTVLTQKLWVLGNLCKTWKLRTGWSDSLLSAHIILKVFLCSAQLLYHLHTYEPQQDKTNKMTVHPAKIHLPSLLSLCYPHEEAMGPWLPTARTAKTLIRLGAYPGWSESSLGAHTILWICRAVAHITILEISQDPFSSI